MNIYLANEIVNEVNFKGGSPFWSDIVITVLLNEALM